MVQWVVPLWTYAVEFVVGLMAVCCIPHAHVCASCGLVKTCSAPLLELVNALLSVFACCMPVVLDGFIDRAALVRANTVCLQQHFALHALCKSLHCVAAALAPCPTSVKAAKFRKQRYVPHPGYCVGSVARRQRNSCPSPT